MILLAVGLLQAAQAQAAPQPVDLRSVQVGARVQPDTVTVGDRFTVYVRVRAPVGSTFQFPAGPDSGTVEPVVDAAFSQPRTDSLWVEQIAGYRLAAWDIEAQPIALGDVVVRLAGAERRLALPELSVFVRSVLPADTSLHVPKPAREPLLLRIPGWVWWLLAALLALLLALLLWWLWRRLRRREKALPPFEAAEREFARIEALKLPEQDECARHVALMTDVLRDYLAARVPEVTTSQISRELVRAAAASPDARWDAPLRSRAERLLERADLAKFAAVPIPPDEARTLGADARGIVTETERRITRPEQEERAAA